MMGATQLAWLQGQLAASKATWQVLGQQVLMARMEFPVSVLTALNPDNTGAAAVAAGQKAIADYLDRQGHCRASARLLTNTQKALLNPAVNPQLGYNVDAWDGYPVDEKRYRALRNNWAKSWWCWPATPTMPSASQLTLRRTRWWDTNLPPPASVPQV